MGPLAWLRQHGSLEPDPRKHAGDTGRCIADDLEAPPPSAIAPSYWLSDAP